MTKAKPAKVKPDDSAKRATTANRKAALKAAVAAREAHNKTLRAQGKPTAHEQKKLDKRQQKLETN